MQFATGIIWHLRHVETKRNVADSPSRNHEHLGRRLDPPCMLNKHGCDSPRAVSAPSKPIASQHGMVQCFPVSRGQFFLELFSGQGGLTKAIIKTGMTAVEPIEILNGAHCDLRRRTTQDLIVSWIEKGIFGFIHLGTPCVIWSKTQHGVMKSHRSRCKEDGL